MLWVSSCNSHRLSLSSNSPFQSLPFQSSLVVQLARDLQTDFYPHFEDFFVTITSILETQDTELLEWAFTSLSYLYKYLWRLMVKDMPKIYRWPFPSVVRFDLPSSFALVPPWLEYLPGAMLIISLLRAGSPVTVVYVVVCPSAVYSTPT